MNHFTCHSILPSVTDPENSLPRETELRSGCLSQFAVSVYPIAVSTPR